VDTVESGRGTVPGLGLLPVATTFAPDKVLAQRSGHCAWLGTDAAGYEIRHGRVERHGGEPLLDEDGCRVDAVLGTSWHGALEHDAFRRALLGWVAERCGRRFAAGTTPFAAAREARLDVLGDLVADHLDTDRLGALIEAGPPPDLPVVRAGVEAHA
jgi:adenosylcobyric acid synthase